MTRGATLAALAALFLVACATGPVPTPTATPFTPVVTAAIPMPSATVGPTFSPGPSPAYPTTLHVDGMATVLERTRLRLEPGGDPGGPQGCDREGSRCFERIEAGQQVFLYAGPVTVDGVDYWQVASSAYPGCCAPLGWVPASDSSPVLEPYVPECPSDPGQLTAAQLDQLGGMASIACFGSTEIVLEGTILCEGGIADASYFLGGTDWAEDPYGYGPFCSIRGPSANSLRLWGDAVYSLMPDEHQTTSVPKVTVYGNFDHSDSESCLWRPGNYSPINVTGAPREPARFACRTQFVVSRVEVESLGQADPDHANLRSLVSDLVIAVNGRITWRFLP